MNMQQPNDINRLMGLFLDLQEQWEDFPEDFNWEALRELADFQRVARRYAARTSGLSGAPRPTWDQVSSWMIRGPISASHSTSICSPWASSAMQDSRSVVKSGCVSFTASTSQGRPRTSTNWPCWMPIPFAAAGVPVTWRAAGSQLLAPGSMSLRERSEYRALPRRGLCREAI